MSIREHEFLCKDGSQLVEDIGQHCEEEGEETEGVSIKRGKGYSKDNGKQGKIDGHCERMVGEESGEGGCEKWLR